MCKQTESTIPRKRSSGRAEGAESKPAAKSATPQAPSGSAFKSAVLDLLSFYQSMWYYLVDGGDFESCPYLHGRVQARCQVYSLSLIFFLWDKPHYRNGTFADDMRKNLINVAVPGTGIALSWFCYFRVIALGFVLFAYPFLCFVSALKSGDFDNKCRAFSEQLLEPKDWFSFWRMNCRLASLHAYHTKDEGYDMEDKWTFLTEGKARGVPVSPWLDVGKLFVKHRNEEGGLGCAAYKNAIDGGDWIIQECLKNGEGVKEMLPDDAPLSTFRVVTASRGGLTTSSKHPKMVNSLSCVFRAGRAGAMTDHQSILFDVDTVTGKVNGGTTNEHWYKLGLDKCLHTPWTCTENWVEHPDTGRAVAGRTIENIREILDLVEDAHTKLAPGVPTVGWDVAVTTKGMFLLEGNFSCNFFRGSFDHDEYFRFVEGYFLDLEASMKQETKTKAAA